MHTNVKKKSFSLNSFCIHQLGLIHLISSCYSNKHSIMTHYSYIKFLGPNAAACTPASGQSSHWLNGSFDCIQTVGLVSKLAWKTNKEKLHYAKTNWIWKQTFHFLPIAFALSHILALHLHVFLAQFIIFTTAKKGALSSNLMIFRKMIFGCLFNISTSKNLHKN